MALRTQLLHLVIVLLLLGGCSPAPEPEPEWSYVPTPLHRELERELDGELMTEGISIEAVHSFEDGEMQAYLRVPKVTKIDERDPYRVFAAFHRLGHRGASSMTFESTRWDGTVRTVGFLRAEAGQLDRHEGHGPRPGYGDSWLVGIAEGVTPELIASIAEGDAPLPVFEPPLEGVEYEWDPVTGWDVAEPEEY